MHSPVTENARPTSFKSVPRVILDTMHALGRLDAIQGEVGEGWLRWRSCRLSEVKAVDVEAWLKTLPLRAEAEPKSEI
jgi:hypothetical protein